MTFVQVPWQPIVTTCIAILSGIIWIVIKITRIETDLQLIKTNHLRHIEQRLMHLEDRNTRVDSGNKQA